MSEEISIKLINNLIIVINSEFIKGIKQIKTGIYIVDEKIIFMSINIYCNSNTNRV